jgi:ABC-type spermidine/putrescine transport system permease subunit I
MAGMSPQVYSEIIRTLASVRLLPSQDVVAELAAAVGISEQRLKNDYTAEYHGAGNKGDPWEPADPLYPE